MFLEEEIKCINVVLMPDFFLDRFMTLNRDLKHFTPMLRRVIDHKGGCIDGISQTDLRGGNAVNTASALVSLGVNTTPLVCTSKLGSKLIRFHLKSQRADLSHVKIFERASITTAMEFENKKGKVNVMLRDVGSLTDFGPHHLDDEDFHVIQDADYVCVFNWAGTRRFGTELADTVFRFVKDKGKGRTYYDTADPSTNKEKLPELMENVLQSKHIDILSVNENEAVCYASQLSSEVEKLSDILSFEELVKESARILSAQLSLRVDLHTTKFVATFTERKETIVRAFKVPVLRVTGAGDAWNAGNILGDAYGLSDEVRLTLANAVAAYYISNPGGEHATREDLREFCKDLSKKKS